VDDVAKDHMPDVLGRDSGTPDGFADHSRAEIGRRHFFQSTTVFADWGANATEYGYFTLICHGMLPPFNRC
jgi:hypothetical protein